MHWYQVFKGTKRSVVAVPALGVVFKFPRFNKKYIRDFFTDIQFAWTEMLGSPNPENHSLGWETIRSSFKRNCGGLFGGIADNYRERRYYKKSNDLVRSLLKPTYMSFLGFLNIQRLGVPSNDMAVYHAACIILGKDMDKDGHHWDTPSNFDVSSGYLQLLDYGSKATQTIIDKHATALCLKFDLVKGIELREQYAARRAAKTNKPRG